MQGNDQKAIQDVVNHATVLRADIKVDLDLITSGMQYMLSFAGASAQQVLQTLRHTTPSSFSATSITSDRLAAATNDVIVLLEAVERGVVRADFGDQEIVVKCKDTLTQVHLDTLHDISNERPSRVLTDTMLRRRTLLDLLDFRQMSVRIEEVDIAYKTTLEWIFRNDEYYHTWSSFPDFLKGDAVSPYWLNGKAGSGKSTLVRFLVCHDETTSNLRLWSSNKHLEIGHFFAWNLGTNLQKARLGLLQSLIFQMLSKDQRLIHQVFTDLWRSFDSQQPRKLMPLSLTETKHAFMKMVDLCRSERYFCFFIDGIDEFDEDVNSVADLLLELRASNLKFVLSSRPIDECSERFGSCPQLRLQDLTAGDIKTYIDGKLRSSHIMTDLFDEHPDEAQELINELENRADGVFLWVRLVVNSLLIGLRKGDNIEDLKFRLRELPPDLGDLYAKMLSKMDPGHKHQAAILFRLVRCALTLLDGQNLPTQFLAVGYHNFTSVINRKPVAFETEKILRWCTVIARQFVSRCCGLIEVSWSVYKPDWWQADLAKLTKDDANILASHVQFLHRTVAEYLFQDKVWTRIAKRSSETSSFEPHKNLTYAALHMMKIAPLADNLESMQAYVWAQHLVRSARQYERLCELPLEDALDEMDLVLMHHTSSTSHWSSLVDIYASQSCIFGRPTVLGRPLTGIRPFAAFVGLGAYLDSKLQRDSTAFDGALSQNVMLQTMFSESKDWRCIELRDKVDAVCCILEQGADPNKALNGPSFWQCCLQQVAGMVCTKPSESTQSSTSFTGRRRRSSNRNHISTLASAVCCCSVDVCKEWAQLMVACLRAGADRTDVKCLASLSVLPVEGDGCLFLRMCQTLYNTVNGTPIDQTQKAKISCASFQPLQIPDFDKHTTYGESSISGNARTHFGDNYNITIQNYSPSNDQPSEPLMDKVYKQSESLNADLLAEGEHSIGQDLSEALTQFRSEIALAMVESSSAKLSELDIGDTAIALTDGEANLVQKWHWRGSQPKTF